MRTNEQANKQEETAAAADGRTDRRTAAGDTGVRPPPALGVRFPSLTLGFLQLRTRARPFTSCVACIQSRWRVLSGKT